MEMAFPKKDASFLTIKIIDGSANFSTPELTVRVLIWDRFRYRTCFLVNSSRSKSPSQWQALHAVSKYRKIIIVSEKQTQKTI